MKVWWASKTVWVNLLAMSATISTVFGVDLGLTPEAQAQILAGIMTIVNIALRFVTKEPIG